MAKMFYTAEEAAKKIGVSVEKVQEMAASGQLQEFRDRDKLVFKREQVDMLSGGEEGGADSIPLADSGEMISLAADDSKGGSGSNAGAQTKDKSGISIFDADDDADQSDPSAQTQITSSVGGMTVQSDPGASGSAILDMTRGDDTNLGANLLQDVYGDNQGTGAPIGGDASPGDSGLFEGGDAAGAAMAGAGVAMVAAEPYDGAASGWAGGLALAMIVCLGLLLAVTVLTLTGGAADLLSTLAGNFYAVVGGLAGFTALAAGIGWFLGRKG
jgi:excisionase family DNA binding protein